MNDVCLKVFVLLILICTFCNGGMGIDKVSEIDQIVKLKMLLDEGAINQKEYEKLKYEVLDNSTESHNSLQNNVNRIDNHEYVDLGLPNGTLWATCNVGASVSTQYGFYFSWGETEPKKDYSWSTYKWSTGEDKKLIKYCLHSDYGYVDQKNKLENSDDAAMINWGKNWRMPTVAEVEELIDGCEWKWTKNYQGSGIAGRVGTSIKNGNVIFLPAAGRRSKDALHRKNECGYFWAVAVYEKNSKVAYYINAFSDCMNWKCGGRFEGRSVRAVVNKKL